MQGSRKNKSRKPWWFPRFTEVARLWRLVKSSTTVHCYGADHKNSAKLRKPASIISSIGRNPSSPSRSLCVTVNSHRTYPYPSLGNSCFFGLRSDCYVGKWQRYQDSSIPLAKRKKPLRDSPASAATVHPAPLRRKVFRGKSVMDNSLLRKSAMEEEAMLMVKLRKGEAMAVGGAGVSLRKSTSGRRRQIGPSPLRHVVSASASPCCR